MKSITLYLVVAGATYFNQLDRFQGWSGTPLTPTGKMAVETQAQQLRPVQFATAATDDTSRGQQTLDLLLRHNESAVMPQALEDLRGPFYGGFEGQERAAVWSGFATKLGYASDAAFAADQTPSELQTLLHDHDAARLAENGAEFWHRYLRGLTTVYTEVAAQTNVLLVVDGAVARMIRYLATKQLPAARTIAPASLTVATFDGQTFQLLTESKD
ncbi:histidine phosphatase family protein [Lactiplantibacillus modestisalitolerans]|uniref:Histidine phosphatase family protein n=1 Tax=Lactiplantibacillus modestisalitolerans TaxID=1457219 RepID=A0ABV5WRM4_9LACO|nr:histidine phosphatase family protein [Lactiplantibacillus modestisalitolerans]